MLNRKTKHVICLETVNNGLCIKTNEHKYFRNLLDSGVVTFSGVVVSETNEKRMYILLIKPPKYSPQGREEERKRRGYYF